MRGHSDSCHYTVKLQQGDGNFVFVCKNGYSPLNLYNGALKGWKVVLLDNGNLQQSSASGVFWQSLFSDTLTTFKPIASLAGTFDFLQESPADLTLY